MFIDRSACLVLIDKKFNQATILHPENAVVTTTIGCPMHIEMDVSNMTCDIDLARLLDKYNTTIEDVDEADIIAILNEDGYFDEPNKHIRID